MNKNKKLKVNQDLLNKDNATICGELVDIIHAYETDAGLHLCFMRGGYYGNILLSDKNLALMPNFNLTHIKVQDLMVKYNLIKAREA